jgi:hypothetical protein
MGFNLILFIIYTGAFVWFVPKLAFVQRAGLDDTTQRLLIIFKMLCALAAATYLGSLPNSDHLMFNKAMEEQFRILINNPSNYFNEIDFQYEQYGTRGLFEASNSFWGYIRHHLVYMLTAPMNFISGGNFYLNAVIFSSFTYFGHLFFFKIYHSLYPGHRWIIITACFAIPSLLLFTSCVHKDGFVFVSLGLMSYVFYRRVQYAKILSFKYIAAFLLALACVFFLRNYVLVALLPAMVVAYLVHHAPRWKIGMALIAYVLFAILFFVTGLFNSPLNLPEAVVKRKHDFALLEAGKSNLPMHDLQPGATSFVKNTPQAIFNVLLRPHPFDGNSMASVLAALELYVYLFILAFALWKRKNNLHSIHSFNIYGIAFFFSMVLIIGFTIPNMGAIVRYRSLLWIFVLAPALVALFSKKTTGQENKY